MIQPAINIPVAAPKELYSVTAIVAVMNETNSLRETCRILLESNPESWFEVLIVFSPRTTPESMAVIRELEGAYVGRLTSLLQTRKFVGGAFQDAFEHVKTTHLIMMSSDLETDPSDARALISVSKTHPKAIVAANRWIVSSGFSGYQPLKLALNYCFQKMFGLIFSTNLSDMTYGYRLYPTEVVRKINWECARHPFFFESILKPLRMKVEVFEVPSKWRCRTEGESQNTFFRNFEYIKWGLLFRICPMSRVRKG